MKVSTTEMELWVKLENLDFLCENLCENGLLGAPTEKKITKSQNCKVIAQFKKNVEEEKTLKEIAYRIKTEKESEMKVSTTEMELWVKLVNFGFSLLQRIIGGVRSTKKTKLKGFSTKK